MAKKLKPAADVEATAAQIMEEIGELVAPEVERLSQIRAELQALKGEPDEAARQLAGLQARIASLREKAAQALGRGEEPLATIRELRNTRDDLADLEELHGEVYGNRLQELKAAEGPAEKALELAIQKAIDQAGLVQAYESRLLELLAEAAGLCEAWRDGLNQTGLTLGGRRFMLGNWHRATLRCTDRAVGRVMEDVPGIRA